MTDEIAGEPAQLFSEEVANNLRDTMGKLVDSIPEVEGIAAVIIYHPRLGDDIEPSIVMAGPHTDPLFITRAVCQTCKFQQRIVQQLEAAMHSGVQTLQAIQQETDERKATLQETQTQSKV